MNKIKGKNKMKPPGRRKNYGGTTVVIPLDISREIKKLKDEKDLPSLWRAIEIYFEEKDKEKIEVIKQEFEKIRAIMFGRDKLLQIANAMGIAWLNELLKKYPQLEKDNEIKKKAAEQTIKIYPNMDQESFLKEWQKFNKLRTGLIKEAQKKAK